MTFEAQIRVREALDAAGISTEIKTFEASTATSQQAADCLGVPVGAIAKSVCFMVAGRPVLVIASGDTRIDDRKLGALYDVSRKKVRIASAEQVQVATGYTIGGVAPIGHVSPIDILVDSSLSRFDLVYAAAGSAHSVFGTTTDELVSLTGAHVVQLSKD